MRGRSLLAWAGAVLSDVTDELIVAAPAGFEAAVGDELPAARVITGGADRQETVRLLVQATDSELVLVHDAARPFLTPAVAARVLQAAELHGAATASLPVSDTLVDRTSGTNVEREQLALIQTPQAFRRELLERAHQQAVAAGFTATDDAALVRRLGVRVQLVTGSPWLLKITHPQDLKLAEALAAGWNPHDH